jgi:osmotically-inducible protein OsmY
MKTNIAYQDLRGRVKLYLAATRPEFSALDVEVAGDSTVHLSGSVCSLHCRQLAIAAAQRVTGVRKVIHELRVPDWSLGRYDAR